MIIYIRHANDEESNPKYKHDTHITEKGKKEITKFIHKLVKKYGYPDKIYFSPFQRCKETVTEMINEIVFIKTGKYPNCCLKCYSHEIELIEDHHLSRYFSKKDMKKPSVAPKTLKHKIPMDESHNEFHERLEKHITKVKKDVKENNEIIWCITHAITFKKIGKKLHVNTADHIKFLDHFVYK